MRFTQPAEHPQLTPRWKILATILLVNIVSLSIYYLFYEFFDAREMSYWAQIGLSIVVSAANATIVAGVAIGRLSIYQAMIVIAGSVIGDIIVAMFQYFISSYIYSFGSFIAATSFLQYLISAARSGTYWAFVAVSLSIAFRRRIPISFLPVQCASGIVGSIISMTAFLLTRDEMSESIPFTVYAAGFVINMLTLSTLGFYLRYYAPVILNLDNVEIHYPEFDDSPSPTDTHPQ